MGNRPCFYVLQCGKTDRTPLSKKSKEKALKPSGFKAFPVAGAEGLEVASQPLLRCPKKSSDCRFFSIFSTAAPRSARCIRHRRRSQALPGTLRVPRVRLCSVKQKRFFAVFAYEFELSQFGNIHQSNHMYPISWQWSVTDFLKSFSFV